MLACVGCFCFGHSGGGQVALAVEAQQPGTFAAVYAYEPVLSTVAPEQASKRSAVRPTVSVSGVTDIKDLLPDLYITILH